MRRTYKPPVALAYPKGKPLWKRLMKLAGSVLDSVASILEDNPKIKAILDFIREYFENVEAAMEFNEH
jgi:hypothetical protein